MSKTPNNDLIHLTRDTMSINIDGEADTTYHTDINFGSLDRNKFIFSGYYFSNSLNDIPTQSFAYYYAGTPALYRVQHRWNIAQRITLIIVYVYADH